MLFVLLFVLREVLGASDGFSGNLLEGLVVAPVKASARGVQVLSDGSFAVVGTVWYPAGYVEEGIMKTSPSLKNVEDVDKERLTAFVGRVKGSEMQWGVRLALVKEGGGLGVTVDDADDVYVVGSSKDGNEEVGFMTKVSGEGDVLSEMRGGVGGYVKVFWNARYENMVYVVRQAPAGVFGGGVNAPSSTGLIVARVKREDLMEVDENVLSERAGDKLVADRFWDACMGEVSLYVSAKRQTMGEDWTHTHTPTVFEVDLGNLKVRNRREIDRELQNGMSVQVGREGVYVTYVARVNNREEIVVRVLGVGLVEGRVWRRRIEMDVKYTRAVRSSVVDVFVDEQVTLLMYSAEILDKSVEDWQVLRRLGNGRPGVIVFGLGGEEVYVRQSMTESTWSPKEWYVNEKEFTVVGEDESGGEALFLKVGREEIASPTPTTSASPRGRAIDKSEDGEDGKECLGRSSVVDGVTIEEVIKTRGWRLQWHPMMRDIKRDMLCWKNAESKICATKLHVVKVGEEWMYMGDFCGRVKTCWKYKDYAVNFKTRCGNVLQVGILGISMHVGWDKVEAREAVERECRMQRGNWIRWRFETM